MFLNIDLASSSVTTGLLATILLLLLIVLIIGIVTVNKFPKADNKPIAVADNTKPFVEEGISDEVIAVIAAAIAAISADSKDGKVLSVKSVKYAKAQRPIWAAAGIKDNTMPF